MQGPMRVVGGEGMVKVAAPFTQLDLTPLW